MGNEVPLEKVAQQIFGITPRRYRQMAADEIVPPVKKGLIDFPVAVKQYVIYLKKLAEGHGSLSLTDERVRLTRLNADLKEQQLRREKGLLLDVSTAMKLWGIIIQKIRTKLLAFGVKLPSLLIGLKSQSKIKTKIDDIVREVLNELTSPDLKEIARMASNSGDTDNTTAPPAIQHQRMGGRKKTTKSRGHGKPREMV